MGRIKEFIGKAFRTPVKTVPIEPFTEGPVKELVKPNPGGSEINNLYSPLIEKLQNDEILKNRIEREARRAVGSRPTGNTPERIITGVSYFLKL